MKKIIMVFLMLLYLFSMKNVFAQDQYKLTLHKQDGIYFSRRGGVVTDSNSYYIYKLDGIYAYCIEPGKKITTYNYLGNEEFDLSLSEDVKEKLELIGYYGREYPGHDNVRYSMAAQALIWELTGVNKVTFWTGKNETGKEIDVSSERNEIMNLVNNHKVLPNFPTNFYMYVKHDFEYTDTNNVLENYEVVEDGMQDVFINGNTLHIAPKTPGMYNIKLRRKNYNEYKTIIFVGKDNTTSQKLARLHFSKDIETDVTISVDGTRLLIHKLDSDGNHIKMQGIMFKIKNLETGEYACNDPNQCYFITDMEGLILTDALDYGEYEVEEVENQIVPGYTWNPNKLHISISYDSDIKWDSEYYSYMEFTFSNQEVLGNIEIQKQGEKLKIIDNEINFDNINLSNIKFSLFDINNNFIDSLITDENGIGRYSNLKVGKYYLVEDTIIDDYINSDEKYYFEIKQGNQYDKVINVKLNINNYLKKGILEFTKKDSETNLGIPNTIIEIYKDNELFLTRKTNENGVIVINDLPIGKYYLKETKANDNYLISDEIINFEITDNNEIIKKEMYNDIITGTISINKKGEDYHYVDNEVIYEKINLEGKKFLLYDDDNNYIDTLITDKEGNSKKDNLSLGKYYLIEENDDNNYINNDNKYFFDVIKKDNNQNITVNLEIDNYLKKGILEFSKEDLTTSEGIPDTVIEIYDEMNNLLFTKITDENGKVIINNLPCGKYFIVEKEANKDYQITNEHVLFEIKEDGEIVKAKMINEKVVVEVPKTWQDDNIMYIICYYILLFVIGINIYEICKTH